MLERPIVDTPGSTFTYNSGAVHLLGVLLDEATGTPLPEFADATLFNRIGIRQARWEELTQGYVNGRSGIDLRPRDLTRLGQLFLQDGVSGDDRVLPGGWVGQATVPRYTWRFDFGALRSVSYGYLWWVEEGQPEQAYFAWGFGGQFVFVVPGLDLVVVTTTRWRGVSLDGGPEALEQAALDVIWNDVVPAFR